MSVSLQQLQTQNRRLFQFNLVLALLVVACLINQYRSTQQVRAAANQPPAKLTVSELTVVDSNGVVRARIGGDLPDAVIQGKVHPRGQAAAGVLLYDTTGQERSGYITFASGHVGLTLDNRDGQTAEFLAGPDSGSVFRQHYGNSILEMTVDEDGPALHMVRDKHVVFHEPAVEHPESTGLCKDLRKLKSQVPKEQLMGICTNHTTEQACQVCLNQ
ncbi:MAG: hypothetical protein WBY53_18260 [Acidobacteriaceae bacterium]